jgi:hypothetical protein
MLGPETSLGPAVSGVEFNAQKVTDFPKNAVFDPAYQFSARIRDADGGAQRNRALYLKARARKRNVFQIGDAPAVAVILVPPLDIHQIRTQHSGFNAPVQHSLYQF